VHEVGRRRHFPPHLQARRRSQDQIPRTAPHVGHVAVACWRAAACGGKRLGHAEVTTTLQTYAHVLPDMSQDAAAKLAAVLHGAQQNLAASQV